MTLNMTYRNSLHCVIKSLLFTIDFMSLVEECMKFKPEFYRKIWDFMGYSLNFWFWFFKRLMVFLKGMKYISGSFMLNTVF